MSKNYRVTRNYGMYQERVNNFLQTLLINSKNYFRNQMDEGKILKGHHRTDDSVAIHECQKLIDNIKYVDDFLYYYYKHNHRQFAQIFQTISRLKAISVLDDADRGIYGITTPNDYILINPDLPGNGILNSGERTRLYVAHELGHVINSKWKRTTGPNLRTYVDNGTIDKSEQCLINTGFELIDEATTQDRAEEIAYFYANKQRPSMRLRTDPRGMYSGESYKTNYDFYGELQEPLLMFARTLRGIGRINYDQLAIKEISTRALNPKFVDSIYYEYQRDGQINNLFKELKLMGQIKNGSYARFGYANQNEIYKTKKSFDDLKRITNTMRDSRPPFDENGSNGSNGGITH